MENIANINVDALVDDIYAAPIRPDLWARVLDGLAHRVSAVGGGLLIQRNGNWLGWRASTSLEPDASKITAQYIFARKLLPERLIELNRPGFVADQELFDDEEFKTLPFYKDFCEPHDLRHLAGTAITLPTNDIMVLFVIRMKNKPAFDCHDLELLDALRPHIARDGILTTRLGFEKMRSFTEAFSSISLPAMVIDSDCKIIAKNTYIDEHREFIKPRRDDVLEFNNSRSTDILRETAQLLDQRISSSAKSIPVMSADGKHAIAHIIPIGSAYANFFDWESSSASLFHSACCSVIIAPISPTKEADKTLLRSLFDLTPAEARVAEEVLHGHATGKIASHLGVTLETVRTHLKRIFMKTGVQSQPQLVSLLAGITKVRLENSSRHDPLTGLLNHAAGEQALKSEFVQMKASGQAYSILMIDFGHAQIKIDPDGPSPDDDLIKGVARAMKRILRETDTIFRVSDGKFTVILPATTLQAAYVVAERARLAVGAVPNTRGGGLHIRIGVATAKPDDFTEEAAIDDANEQIKVEKKKDQNQTKPNQALL